MFGEYYETIMVIIYHNFEKKTFFNNFFTKKGLRLSCFVSHTILLNF